MSHAFQVTPGYVCFIIWVVWVLVFFNGLLLTIWFPNWRYLFQQTLQLHIYCFIHSVWHLCVEGARKPCQCPLINSCHGRWCSASILKSCTILPSEKIMPGVSSLVVMVISWSNIATPHQWHVAQSSNRVRLWDKVVAQ